MQSLLLAFHFSPAQALGALTALSTNLPPNVSIPPRPWTPHPSGSLVNTLARLENRLNPAEGADIERRIAVDRNKIGNFADFNGANLIIQA